MPIRMLCMCGCEVTLPDRHAGAQVNCPACKAALKAPSAAEDATLMRFICSCGQRLKARAKSAGQILSCPRCHGDVIVPAAPEEPKAKHSGIPEFPRLNAPLTHDYESDEPKS